MSCSSRQDAIYARVSSDRQKENHPIASQVAALINHAETHGYMLLPEWRFEDQGHSGATLLRPGRDALRDGATAGQIEAVLVYSLDRLGRQCQVLLAGELSSCGASRLKAPSSATDEDQVLVQFQGMIAETSGRRWPNARAGANARMHARRFQCTLAAQHLPGCAR